MASGLVPNTVSIFIIYISVVNFEPQRSQAAQSKTGVENRQNRGHKTGVRSFIVHIHCRVFEK